MSISRAWTKTDADALETNLVLLRRRIGPAVSFILVAKGDAYGHGAVAIARVARRHGVDAFGVTTVEEALELRAAGIQRRILVLGPTLEDEAPAAVREGIELCLPSLETVEPLRRTASRVGRRARVHAKLDTGMGRLGVPPARFLELLTIVRRAPELELAGVMTHLAATQGALEPSAARQMRCFTDSVRSARERGLLVGRGVWCHAANSAAVLSGLAPLHDAVRVGLAAYGISPDPHLPMEGLRPVLSVHARIVHFCERALGETTGYGGTWTAARPTRLAVLPLGYDDGLDLRLANRGHFLLHGVETPIVGRISMAYTTVDVTDVPAARLGDTVTVIGRDGDRVVRVEDLAAAAGTIPYDLTCALGRRLPRWDAGRGADASKETTISADSR